MFTYTPTATARHAAAKTGATTATTTDTVTVTVTDSKGAVTTQAVTVAVSPRNTAPTGARATVGTPNALTGVVTGTVTATDADKDPLTYTTPASTSKGTVSVTATGAFTYTPTALARQNAAQSGATAADQADSFTVTVTDGYGGSTSVPVNVVVSPRAPITTTVGLKIYDFGPGNFVQSYFPEGDSGTSIAQVPVVLSAASTDTVTVNYTVARAYGAAFPGVDFLAESGTLTFTPGQTTANIPITIFGDTRYEAEGVLQVRLTGATNAVVTLTGSVLEPQSDKFIHITNDDPVSV